MIIYHIVLPDEWERFTSGLYRAASLDTEGFIHCSFADQLDAVIARYYADADNLVVLGIETDLLMSRIIKETSTKSEIYPHVYGPINRNAIISVNHRKNLAANEPRS